MRSLFLLASLTLAHSQESDDTAYLLQTVKQRQKAAEVEDCYVSGGCVTTTTTTYTVQTTPTTTTTTTTSYTTTTKKQRRRRRKNKKTTAAPTTTTTAAPTTTTAAPTTTTTPTTTTSTTTTPTTTTTSTTTTPSFDMRKEKPPPGRETEGDGDVSHSRFCSKRAKLDVSRLVQNNLGGMGPDRGKAELRYSRVTTVQRQSVDLVITSQKVEDNSKPKFGFFKGKGKGKGGKQMVDRYLKANERFSWRGIPGKAFIAKYNGNRYRKDVMAIGSLGKGSFKFKFSFVNSVTGKPVPLPFVPMTFFDLDGKDIIPGKSFEELETWDAEGVEYVKGTQVAHSCRRVKGKQLCSCKSAKVEIPIPPSFDHLTPETAKAAITLFFKGKSSFELTYTLNYEHRVFLFKGQCFD